MIHDQTIRTGEARAAAELGLTEWLGVGAIVPYRLYNTSIRYLDPASGDPVAIDNPFVHHPDETLTGIGDPWLYARAARSIAGTSIGVRGGLTIPLGRTVPDPFVLGDLGQPHEHSQFGTGTLGMIAGLEGSRAIGSVRLDASVLTIQTVYANAYGYQAGDRYAAAIGAATSFGTTSFRFRATVESVWETAESWGGVVHTDDGNIGRTDVLAGASITWLATEDWHVGLDIKVPVYTHVVGGEVDALGFVGLSVGTHLHAWGEGEDEHRAPKRDASIVGELGRITVYDYWATWCKPCAELDTKLTAIAAAHAGEVTVKRIDASNDDGVTLPYLRVYGRDGRLSWERSGTPLELAAAVLASLGGRVAIDVTDAGFVPAEIAIDHGRPTVLVFTRRSASTCATDVHFVMPDGTKIDEVLPLDTPIEIVVTPDRAGRIDYACGMNMNHGTIVVR